MEISLDKNILVNTILVLSIAMGFVIYSCRKSFADLQGLSYPTNIDIKSSRDMPVLKYPGKTGPLQDMGTRADLSQFD